MVTIVFESHGTTYDNESHYASGWFDVELSPLGKSQAKELGQRHKDEYFDAVFCSDLQRSYRTGEIAFEGRDVPIIKDKRLRECNYGDWTKGSSDDVEKEKGNRVSIPFPNGESYEQTSERMKNFLKDLLKEYDNKKVMIIGHRATQYGLEYWVKGVPIKKAVTDPWQWQPGWTYCLKEI